MPVDTRRNVGPDDCEDYYKYDLNKPLQEDLLNIKNHGARMDGRESNQQRKIYLKPGVNSRVKGSAYIEVGQTKVVVSVYEPREIPRISEFSLNGELFCEFRIAPFARKERRPSMMQSDEKDVSLALKRALEPAVCRAEFPNFQVDVHVLVLDDDGGYFSAAVTAAGVALADAGVPMYDTIGAVTLGFCGPHQFMDPNLLEEEICATASDQDCGLLSVAYLVSLGQISSMTFTGGLTMERVLENLELTIERCTHVADLSRQVLTNDVISKSKEDTDEIVDY